MIIDFHTHLFPDKLAPRTIPHLQSICGISPSTDGTLADTLAKLDQWGIDRIVTLHIATKPSQQHNVNAFAASVQGERILSFGSVHPAAPDAVAVLEAFPQMGLHGVKLHADYQDFFVDDRSVYPIYETCAHLKLPIVFHAGEDPLSPNLIHASPKALAQVAQDFPTLTLIAAHLGGMKEYDQVEAYLMGRKNVWLDTSMAAEYCPPAQYVRIIRGHGIERILFASDCPWSTPLRQLAFLEEADFTPGELDRITYQNAQELLGL